MTITADSWLCNSCRTPLPPSDLAPSISDRLMIGRCRRCDKDRMFSRATGEELKAAGMAEVQLAAGQGTDEAWRLEAERTIRSLAEQRVQFTANDVTDRVGLPSRRNLTGALINAMSRQAVIRRVGYRTGDRASQRARIVSVWEGVS